MHQILIIEKIQNNYTNLLNQYLKSGYKLIAGSSYIKSLPTYLTAEGSQALNDIDHVFSIGITDNNFDSIIFTKDLDAFRSEVNKQLKNNKIIVGSLYIEKILKDSYEKFRRLYTTYYCCCLYKE